MAPASYAHFSRSLRRKTLSDPPKDSSGYIPARRTLQRMLEAPMMLLRDFHFSEDVIIFYSNDAYE